jgi:cell wall-associated NlpC family hydrolase
MKLERAKLIALMEPTFEGHEYLMDSKPKLGLAPNSWKLSDCSGYIRWLVWGAFGVKLPDGSANQHAWSQLYLPEVPYRKVGPLKDNVLYIAFIAPKGGHPGHVWLLCSGMTIECYGGHGPGRRSWDTEVLLENVAACYELGELI